MRPQPAVRDADERGPDLVFRASATYYAAFVDGGACRRLVDGLATGGVPAEAVARRDTGIVTLSFGLGARRADRALLDAERVLAAVALAAGLADVPHALGVVRVAR